MLTETLDDIILNREDWYASNGIRLLLGRKVTGLNWRGASRSSTMAPRCRMTACCWRPDRIRHAAGAGCELDGVVTFRDIRDVNLMIDAAARYRHAVVIGGGLLGLEAANGLAARGMDVSVVHLGEALLDRQLDGAAAGLLAEPEARGCASDAASDAGDPGGR